MSKRKQYENLTSVVDELELSENSTVQEVVDTLVNLGHDDKVHTFHDDFLGLESSLSSELLQTRVSELEDEDNEDLQEQYSSEIEDILDEANTILYYWNRELSENDEIEIAEERARLGLDDD